MLQAYATQEIVKKLGHEAIVIDYCNKAVEDVYNERKLHLRFIFRKRFWLTPKYIIEKYLYWKQRREYHSFNEKYINLSSKHGKSFKEDELKEYDLVLIGSDQLWNKKITGGFDRLYWGDFKTKPTAKIITWSISMNDLGLDENEKGYVRLHLENFSAISVREESLKTMLSDFTNKEIIQTLDPTLLLPRNKWEELCHPVKERDYIAVYAIQGEAETINLARAIGERMQKKVVVIHNYSRLMPGGGHIQCGGPCDFLSYIRFSDLVVTSSFHGTAFSLIFEKNFVCFEPLGKENSRIRSLLRYYGLEEHIIKDATTLPSFDRKWKDIQMAKQSTLSFLKNALSESNN